jgi:hypothetical protein
MAVRSDVLTKLVGNLVNNIAFVNNLNQVPVH